MKEIYQQTVKDKIQRQNQEFSMEGLRVLAFTYRENFQENQHINYRR